MILTYCYNYSSGSLATLPTIFSPDLTTFGFALAVHKGSIYASDPSKFYCNCLSIISWLVDSEDVFQYCQRDDNFWVIRQILSFKGVGFGSSIATMDYTLIVGTNWGMTIYCLYLSILKFLPKIGFRLTHHLLNLCFQDILG